MYQYTSCVSLHTSYFMHSSVITARHSLTRIAQYCRDKVRALGILIHWPLIVSANSAFIGQSRCLENQWSEAPSPAANVLGGTRAVGGIFADVMPASVSMHWTPQDIALRATGACGLCTETNNGS